MYMAQIKSPLPNEVYGKLITTGKWELRLVGATRRTFAEVKCFKCTQLVWMMYSSIKTSKTGLCATCAFKSTGYRDIKQSFEKPQKGETYGDRVLTGKYKRESSKTYVEARCKCGDIKYIQYQQLKGGRADKCRKCSREKHENAFVEKFEDYRNFCIEHKRIPRIGEAKNRSGRDLYTWRANHVGREKGNLILEFEETIREQMTQQAEKDKKERALQRKYEDILGGYFDELTEKDPKTMVDYYNKFKLGRGYVFESDLDSENYTYTLPIHIKILEFVNKLAPGSIDENELRLMIFIDDLFGGIKLKDYWDKYKAPDLQDKVNGVKVGLTERQQITLDYYGIRNGTKRTLVEIAEELGISPTRVKQILAKTMRTIRHPYRSKQLLR